MLRLLGSIGLVVVLTTSVAGCGGGDEATSEDPNVITFQSGTYHLEPGQERYVCFTTHLPADRDLAIAKVTPDYGNGVHHIFYAWTIKPEADGEFDCPVLFEPTWIPIYLGGVGSDPLTMPAGSGLSVPKGNQLLLQLHLQNTSAKPIDDHVTMKMRVIDKSPDVVQAGIFGLDNRVIEVPANSTDVKSTMDCQPNLDMNVFAVLGHMHKLGKHIQLSRKQASGDEVLYGADWNFDEQPVTPASFTLGTNDTLNLECTHENPTPTAVGYGESSDTEMCAAILYYTTYKALDGCVNTQ
jgi:Copper type II ascorbate-dependent monooxygenase, C-terminal domain